jgi:AraC family transcriptional regulator
LGAHAASAVSVLLRQLRSEFGHHDAAQSLALEGIVLQIAATIVRGDTTAARAGREERAVGRVQEMLADGGSRVPDWGVIAAAVDVAQVDLFRAFRRTLGCTPAAYVRRRRVDAAARALVTTNAPVGRIAVDAGYYDQAHFTRSFRARFGLTPSAYRKMHLG